MRNVLLYQDAYGLYGPYPTGYGENVTFDRCGFLAYETVLASGYLSLVNSLLVQITNGCNFSYSSNYCRSTNSSTAAFQTVSRSGHYLAVNDWRNAGTTSINAGLLADLRKKTTYPPIVWSGDITNETVLAPQALRDDDPPDLGYHYDPLDWVFHNISLTNAQLSLTNGVALCLYGVNGLNLKSGAKVYSEGTPLAFNHMVRYPAVQEVPTNLDGTTGTVHMLQINGAWSVLPEIRLRFTEISHLSDNIYRQVILANSGSYPFSLFSFTDCQLHGGQLYLAPYLYSDVRGMTVAFTNNLVRRANITLIQGYNNDQTGLGVKMGNNLFYRGTALLQNNTGTFPWSIYNNEFDGVNMNGSSVLANTTGYNGFVNTPSLGGPGNVSLTNFIYASAALSDYYQSSTGLINAGSTNANLLGLYHYTTQTNQTKETTSLVDIGLHYVALNGQNLPVDTDADGLPDYFEDRNGDWATNDTFNWTVARTHTAFPGDLQEYELSWNILVNDPAQDYGNEQDTQFESTCAVLNGTVLVGYVDSNQGIFQFGGSPYLTPLIPRFVAYSISHSGGTAFQDKGVPPLSANNYGDAGDPVLAVDKALNLVHLAGTSPRNTNGWKGILFWKSTDGGVTFGQPTTVRDEIIQTDKPWITVDNTTGTGQHDVYLTFTSLANPKRLWLATSTNGYLNNWTTNLLREVDGTIITDLESAIVAVGPDHVAHVVWFERTGTSTYWLKTRKVQNRGSALGVVTNVCQLVFSDPANINFQLKRSNSAAASDIFRAFAFPVVAANPDPDKASHLYVVYADTGQNPGDKSDIFLVSSANGGDNWTSPVRINSVWTNDQWMPVMAIKPDGTKLFVDWYDRRNDSANSLIELYGRFSTIGADGLVNLGDEFRITTGSFPPAFAGTLPDNTNEGYYDPTYPPGGVNLNWWYSVWPANVNTTGELSGHVGEYNGA
ncbi:MAG: hypothetical protein M1608_16765 [Candidatus Omnitrophica bacterium]|nr:hypothetical protein [Candidatus Omnitrophota bacterium]